MNATDFIAAALKDAACLLDGHYAGRASLSYREKGAADLLTQADLEIQRFLVERIRAAFPQDAIVAEEAGLDRPQADPDARCWLIDPIDGTYNFVRGLFPAFGISLALAAGGRPLAGGVALPGIDRLYLAAAGQGARCNGAPLRVSTCQRLEDAQIEVDFSTPAWRSRAVAAHLPLIRAAGQVRSPGCAVVALCAVASGLSEASIDPGLNPWDCAAGLLLVEEAGGRATRLDGSTVHLLDGKRGLLASNGRLHPALTAQVGGH